MYSGPSLLCLSLAGTLSAFAAAGLSSREAVAQESPLVMVAVVAADTRAPLVGAQVTVRGTRTGSATDQRGMARLEGVNPGNRSIEVRALGYLTNVASISIAAGPNDLLLEMVPSPVRIEGIEVDATFESPLELAGFYKRQESSLGSFFTREDIARLRPATLTDIFRRIPGISVRPSGIGSNFGDTETSSRGQTTIRECQPQVFVDRALTSPFNLDHIRPDAIEGMEVYRGAATVPMEYNRGDAACGLVLIWTRAK